MTEPTRMAIYVGTGVIVWMAFLSVFVLPKVTPYSRKQMAALMSVLVVLQTPMFLYIIFVIVPSEHPNPRHFARIGALNLALGVSLFILIGRKILRIRK